MLSEQEHREIDPETLIDPRAFGNGGRSLQELDDATFENEVHIHNAKLFLNNTSRNVSRIRDALTLDGLSILLFKPGQETRRIHDFLCVSRC